MKKFFEMIFINNEGKFSMTVLFAMLAFLIIFTLFFRGLLIGQDIGTPWLEWSIEIAAIAVGVRAGQRGLQFIGEGVAGIGKSARKNASTLEKPTKVKSKAIREEPIEETLEQPTNTKPQQIGWFNVSEFNSPDGVPMSKEVHANVLKLIDNLNMLRAELKSPITIESGYRSQAHNKKVGGAANSQHLYGNAADIKVKGHSPKQVERTIKKLKDKGLMERGGLKAYSTFVHYDRRGQDITW